MSELFQPTPAQAIFGAAHGSYDLPDFAESMFDGILKEWDRVFWNTRQQSFDDHRDEATTLGKVYYRPYCWGDCNCGYAERWDAKDAIWCAEHSHAPDCYQTELRARMKAYDHGESRYAEIERRAFGDDRSLLSGFDNDVAPIKLGGHVIGSSWVGTARTDDAMEAWRMAHTARGAFEDALYDELCATHGVNREFGAAVHCTCDYEALRSAWCATDDHSASCQIVVPNFGIADDSVAIRWYKYPGRGMSVNVKLTTDEWIAWHDRVKWELGKCDHDRDMSRYDGHCMRHPCRYGCAG